MITPVLYLIIRNAEIKCVPRLLQEKVDIHYGCMAQVLYGFIFILIVLQFDGIIVQSKTGHNLRGPLYCYPNPPEFG